MKKLILSAAILMSAVSTVSAGGEGRTVCVIRNRPLAICPPPRPVYCHVVPAVRPVPYNYNYNYNYNSGYYGNGYYGHNYFGYRVPVVYGHINPRLHYVNPCVPNGYVGGIQNLPTNYVNIPRTFTRPASPPRPAARPAAPAARGK